MQLNCLRAKAGSFRPFRHPAHTLHLVHPKRTSRLYSASNAAQTVIALPPELSDFRPNVGVCLVNSQGLVFAATRVDDPAKSWQMPQGGIDPGEEPLAAAVRVRPTMCLAKKCLTTSCLLKTALETLLMHCLAHGTVMANSSLCTSSSCCCTGLPSWVALVVLLQELYEETNIRSVELLAEVPHWLPYEFPTSVKCRLSGSWARYIVEQRPQALCHLCRHVQHIGVSSIKISM